MRGYEDCAREWKPERTFADAPDFLLPHLRSACACWTAGAGRARSPGR